MHPSITKQLVREHHTRLRADATPAAAHLVPRPSRPEQGRPKGRDKVGAALIRWGTRLQGGEGWTTCGATSK